MSQERRGKVGGCVGVKDELSKTSRTLQLANSGGAKEGDREVIYVNEHKW